MDYLTRYNAKGVIVEEFDRIARIYRRRDDDGTITLERPFTPDEDADADRRERDRVSAIRDADDRQQVADFLAIEAPTQLQLLAIIGPVIRLLARRLDL